MVTSNMKSYILLFELLVIGTNVTLCWLAPLFRIREVSSFNLGSEIDHFDEIFSLLLQGY